MFIVPSFRALLGRLGFGLGLSFVALSPVIAQAQSNNPSPSDGFDPNVNGTVFALATQADGKILIGGTFTTVHGVARSNLARVNIDGTLDQGFNPVANEKVTSLVLQSDGKILVGGYFTSLGAVTRKGIARLNADGSVDAGFDPNVGGALSPGVEALLVQSDGKVVAGGTFTTVQANGAASATTRNRLARFFADGSLDTGFDPNVDRSVLALGLQSDGKIVLGGGFTKIQPAGAAEATTRMALARLNADGTLDAGYDPNLNNGVTKLIVQQDGKVVAGGYFTSATPNGATTATTASHLARFNVDGSIDTGYSASVDGNVMALTLQRNGTILVGGSFGAVQGLRRNFVARVNIDGGVDNVFDPNPNFTVFALAEQSDGSVLLGGNFTQLQTNFAASPTTRNHLARVNPTGTLDANFNLDTNGRVLALVVQSDGKSLVGGSFTSVGGVTRNFFARLNTDGTLDTAFDPNFNGQVTAVAIQPDGKILVGGNFTTVKGTSKLHLVRLEANGGIDASFQPNPSNQVNAIAVQSDGKIIIGGYFISLQPNGSATALARSYIARINADGSLDSTWDPGAGGPVLALAIQSDGKILAGGNFLSFITGFRANIARINTDGTLDPSYNPSSDKQVNAIALQSDGKLIIGGAFTFLQPTNAPVVTVVTTNEDGTTTTSQTTTSFRRGVARLNTDGTVDPGFDPSTNNVVRSVAVQADGKILIGGVFTELVPNAAAAATPRNYFARVNSNGTLDESFNLNLDTRIGNQVIAIAQQSDAKILIGGAFSSLQPTGSPTPTTRSQLARINPNGSLDTSFTTATSGATGAVINTLTLQADGRILIGGSFSGFGGTSSDNLARFNSESVPDTFLNPNVNGAVNAVATRLGGGAIGTQLSNLAWLNADGTLKSSFNPTVGITGQVSGFTVQPDGKILVFGAITVTNGATSGKIVRFNADGALDTTFDPKPDAAVNAAAVQTDGKIIIGGSFVNVNGVSRQYVARLNADGSLDTGFDPKTNAAVSAIVIQSDGNIILGGNFTSIQPNGTTNATSINYVARLKPDGTHDNTFSPNPNNVVTTLALEGDGDVLMGGAFQTVLTSSTSNTVLGRKNIARIKSDGTTDATFDPSTSGPVYAIAVQADGKVVLGGAFTFLQANGAPTIVTRNYLARVNADGSLDETYAPNPNGSIVALGVQADGKVVAGGVFTSFQREGATTAVARNRLARINADGAVDGSFDPGPNGAITAVRVLADGSILAGGPFSTIEPTGTIVVGGSFTQVGGQPLTNLALLNVGGSASSAFAPNPNGAVYALAIRTDNRVLAAGSFTTIGGATRGGFAQLTPEGAIDPSFNSSASVAAGPAALLVQPDGKVLLGGTSVSYGGAVRGTLERLNADGSLDLSFNPGSLGAVNALGLQPDGRIIVGGAAPGRLVRLSANGSVDGVFNPAPNGTVSAVLVQSDGKIIVGGTFTNIAGLTVGNIARLNADGSADPTFNPNANGAVTTLALQPGGKVIFGGSFSTVGGESRGALARVAMTSPASQVLEVGGNFSTITWTRSGSGPALTSVAFETSSDGRTWLPLGAASRVASSDTWQLTGQSLTTGASVFIRARGVAPTSQFSSSGVVESVRQFFSTTLPAILSPTTANGTSGSSFYYGITTNVTGAVFSATGLPPGLSLDPSTGLITGTPSAAGVFPVTLTVTNSSGSASITLMLVVNAPGSGGSVMRFVNLSSRARVTPADPMIAGLVISGTSSQTVLLRAVGPGLTGFGVGNAIPHPHMSLYDAHQVLLNENEGWGGSSALSSVFSQVGAFPLTVGSADSALLATLAPGRYSVVVTDSSGATGVALTEVYDTVASASASAPRLVNISTRASANSGETVLIGGFVISGGSSKRLLIRGVGPQLTNFGVGAAMADPVLTLYKTGNVAIASNDNWETPATLDAVYPAVSGAEIAAAASQVGGFAFTAGGKDSAIIITLPPGTYSAQVGSATGTDGTALVEIYELP